MIKRDLISVRLRLALISRKYIGNKKFRKSSDFYRYRLRGLVRRHLLPRIWVIYDNLLTKIDNYSVTMRDFVMSKFRVRSLKKRILLDMKKWIYMVRRKNLSIAQMDKVWNKNKLRRSNSKFVSSNAMNQTFIRARRFYATQPTSTSGYNRSAKSYNYDQRKFNNYSKFSKTDGNVKGYPRTVKPWIKDVTNQDKSTNYKRNYDKSWRNASMNEQQSSNYNNRYWKKNQMYGKRAVGYFRYNKFRKFQKFFVLGYSGYLTRLKDLAYRRQESRRDPNFPSSAKTPEWVSSLVLAKRKWLYLAVLKKIKERMIQLKKNVLHEGRWLTRIWRKHVNRAFKGFFFRIWVVCPNRSLSSVCGGCTRVLMLCWRLRTVFRILKMILLFCFHLRSFDSRKHWLKVIRWSTYIWMFAHYESFVGGVYFPFSIFILNIDVTKIRLQGIVIWIYVICGVGLLFGEVC